MTSQRQVFVSYTFSLFVLFFYIFIQLQSSSKNVFVPQFTVIHQLSSFNENSTTQKLPQMEKKPQINSVKEYLESSSMLLSLDEIGDKDLAQLREVYNQFLSTPIPTSCQKYPFKRPPGNLTSSYIMAKTEIKRLKSKEFLPKTVFNGYPKVVLFAGLEGTGHHFVMRGFRVVFSEKDYAIPFNGYAGVVGCQTHSVVFANNLTVQNFKNSLQSFKAKVVFLNTLTGAATQSYPNCNGKDRVLKEPDARELAEICEELGLDFQIILLNRSPESQLVSTTVNTHYGPNFGHQTVIYNYVIQILLAQLENLDRRFLSACVDIEMDTSEAIKLLSPLKSRIDLDDAKIQQIFARGYQKKKPACIHPFEENTKWNFTKDLSDFYRNSILLTNLCKNIDSFHKGY